MLHLRQKDDNTDMFKCVSKWSTSFIKRVMFAAYHLHKRGLLLGHRNYITQSLNDEWLMIWCLLTKVSCKMIADLFFKVIEIDWTIQTEWNDLQIYIQLYQLNWATGSMINCFRINLWNDSPKDSFLRRASLRYLSSPASIWLCPAVKWSWEQRTLRMTCSGRERHGQMFL